MDFRIIGGRRISGSIKIESAKNSVLPIMAATVLTDRETMIENCPKISDVLNMSQILKDCGKRVDFSDGNMIISGGTVKNSISKLLSSRVRTSLLMLGALAAKCGRAEIPYPGGCKIGGRPIDIHISALKDLGADVREENGYVVCNASISGGRTILPFPSVGATENVLIAAALCEKETIIINAAREPEIVDLADFLNLLGAKIYGAGTGVIRILGVKNASGGAFKPSFDRIEAGTYLIAAAITGGEIELKGVKTENISSLLGKLCDNTCKFKIKDDIIYMRGGKRKNPFELTTGPYPLFPTDMQAQMTALAAVSCGTSIIREEVFKKRFHHVAELRKMGADISLSGNVAEIRGVARLVGATVHAHDLRCGAAMVLAGLNAEGETIVKDIRHLQRGYLEMDKKLTALGADVVKM